MEVEVEEKEAEEYSERVNIEEKELYEKEEREELEIKVEERIEVEIKDVVEERTEEEIKDVVETTEAGIKGVVETTEAGIKGVEEKEGKVVDDNQKCIDYPATRKINFDIFACSEVVFNQKTLAKNSGFYIYMVFVASTTGLFVFFIIKSRHIFSVFMIGKLSPVLKGDKGPSNPSNVDTVKVATKEVNQNKSVKDENNVNNENNDVIYPIQSTTFVTFEKNKADSNQTDKPKEKKTFIHSYLEKIKLYHPILSIIFRKETKFLSILIVSLLFEIQINLGSNALFYNSSYAKHYLEISSTYDGSYNIPKTIYCYLIAVVFKYLINIIKTDLDYKENPELEQEARNLERNNFVKKLKIRIYIYFGIVLVLELILWYFCSAFWGVYKNTRAAWIIDGVISLIYSMVVPLLTALISIGFMELGQKFNLKYCTFISNIMDFIADRL